MWWFEAEGWALSSTRDLKELLSCPKPQFPTPHPDAAESGTAQASWWKSCVCLWFQSCLPSQSLWPSLDHPGHFVCLALLSFLCPAIQRSLFFHSYWNLQRKVDVGSRALQADSLGAVRTCTSDFSEPGFPLKAEGGWGASVTSRLSCQSILHMPWPLAHL